MRIYLINTFKSKGLGFFIGILVPFFIIKCSDEVKTSSPPAVKDGMVLIPAGEFQMGNEGDQARDDESPIHRVGVDAFWMDQTEVT
ncbi:MAG: formylglycine-generating enzyme family protein, partial [Flavobacteriaceae bacterium]|nr:formylglycine-generating enzyme family protein [Flavobacteriaceae bacterium]